MKKPYLKLTSGLLLALSPLSLASCNVSGADIFCSIYPIYEMVRSIAGSAFTVETVTPSGSEPHDYSPSAAQVARMQDARAVFINGLHFEPWGDSYASTSNNVYTVTEGIQTMTVEGTTDPHVWLNPKNMMIEAQNVLSTLINLSPSNEDMFRANYDTYINNLSKLDVELKADSVSVQNKYIVTAHAAFGYFCDAYGLTQIHLSGLSPDQEPSAKALEDILKAVSDYNINTIFYEEATSSSVADYIARETGCKTSTLNPLETTPSRNETTVNRDYLSIMKENMANILATNS